MRVDFAPDTKAAMLVAIRDRLDAGPSAGTLTIGTGAVGTGPVLGKLTLARPCAEMIGDALVFNPIAEDPQAKADGAATWARLADGSGAKVIDTDVSDMAGSGAIKLNTTDIKAGGPLRVSALVLKF